MMPDSIATPPNKALHQTGREGVASFVRRRPVVEARPAGEGRCSACFCGGQIKESPASMGAAPRWDTNGVAGRRGFQLARRSAPLFRRSACRQLRGKGSNGHRRECELGSPSQRGPAQERSVSMMRSVASYQQTQNNALERTRRVGVPAARAIVRVSPRRSTRCYPGQTKIHQ